MKKFFLVLMLCVFSTSAFASKYCEYTQDEILGLSTDLQERCAEERQAQHKKYFDYLSKTTNLGPADIGYDFWDGGNKKGIALIFMYDKGKEPSEKTKQRIRKKTYPIQASFMEAEIGYAQ